MPDAGVNLSIMIEGIRTRMREQGITQRELGTVLGLSQTSISKRLNRYVDLKVAELEGIATHLGCSIEDLLNGSTSPRERQ